MREARRSGTGHIGRPDPSHDPSTRVDRGRTRLVQADPGELHTDLAHLPLRHDLGYEGTTWMQSLTTANTFGRQLTVSISPSAIDGMLNRDEAEPITVRGLDAWHAPTTSALFLPLPAASKHTPQRTAVR